MVICNCIVNPDNIVVILYLFFLILFVDNISGYLSSWGNIGACRFVLVTSNAYL